MTAVEFLVQQICGEHTDAWKEEIQKALELEKQQIMEAYNDGQAIPPFDYAEKYYNRTYKKNKL